jgi:hypothetical protein
MTDIPAFPHTIEHLHEPKTTGMTLRDYFAAKAMLGSIARDGGSLDEGVLQRIAAESYATADAMLKARDAAQ